MCVCVCAYARVTKSPLKVQNGVSEADSPIKKVAKRSRQIVDSDDDDDEAPAVVTKQQVSKEVKRVKVGKRSSGCGLFLCCCGQSDPITQATRETYIFYYQAQTARVLWLSASTGVQAWCVCMFPQSDLKMLCVFSVAPLRKQQCSSSAVDSYIYTCEQKESRKKEIYHLTCPKEAGRWTQCQDKLTSGGGGGGAQPHQWNQHWFWLACSHKHCSTVYGPGSRNQESLQAWSPGVCEPGLSVLAQAPGGPSSCKLGTNVLMLHLFLCFQKDEAFPAVPTPLFTPATPLSPPTPASSSASPGTPCTPKSTSPSGIVKRKTGQLLSFFLSFFLPSILQSVKIAGQVVFACYSFLPVRLYILKSVILVEKLLIVTVCGGSRMRLFLLVPLHLCADGCLQLHTCDGDSLMCAVEVWMRPEGGAAIFCHESLCLCV